jgi:ribonuclease Z
MEFIFTGTSSGTPTKQRNVSGLAIKSTQRKSWCLVDCGEGTQHQLLHTPLSLNRLSAICITHVHGDHCFGLPGLLGSAAMAGRTTAITLIGPAPLQDWLKHTQQMSETYLPFDLNFIDVASMQQAIEVAGLTIGVTALSHWVPSHAYTFSEAPKERSLNVDRLKADQIPTGPLWGQIQKGQDVALSDGRQIRASDYLLAPARPQRVIVGGDNDSPELLLSEAKDAEVLIHEATYTRDVAERVGTGPQHSCARQVAEVAEQAGIQHLILTHFSARYGYSQSDQPNIRDIGAEASEVYTGQLYLANDLDHFRLDTAGQLQQLNQSYGSKS